MSLTAELTTPVSASIYIRATTATSRRPWCCNWRRGSAAAGGGLSQCIGLCIDRRDGRCRIAVGIRRRRRLYLCRRRRLYGERRRIAELGGGDDIATLTATVTIDDSHDNTAPITAGYTLLVVEQLRFASAPPVTITTYDRGEVFYTAEGPGGIGGITYVRRPSTRPLWPPTLTYFC